MEKEENNQPDQQATKRPWTTCLPWRKRASGPRINPALQKHQHISMLGAFRWVLGVCVIGITAGGMRHGASGTTLAVLAVNMALAILCVGWVWPPMNPRSATDIRPPTWYIIGNVILLVAQVIGFVSIFAVIGKGSDAAVGEFKTWHRRFVVRIIHKYHRTASEEEFVWQHLIGAGSVVAVAFLVSLWQWMLIRKLSTTTYERDDVSQAHDTLTRRWKRKGDNNNK